jgi:hypothetical protein
MAASLSPASIRDYSSIVNAVVASALDENGEQRFPRKWNEELAGETRAVQAFDYREREKEIGGKAMSKTMSVHMDREN